MKERERAGGMSERGEHRGVCGPLKTGARVLSECGSAPHGRASASFSPSLPLSLCLRPLEGCALTGLDFVRVAESAKEGGGGEWRGGEKMGERGVGEKGRRRGG